MLSRGGIGTSAPQTSNDAGESGRFFEVDQLNAPPKGMMIERPFAVARNLRGVTQSLIPHRKAFEIDLLGLGNAGLTLSRSAPSVPLSAPWPLNPESERNTIGLVSSLIDFSLTSSIRLRVSFSQVTIFPSADGILSLWASEPAARETLSAPGGLGLS